MTRERRTQADRTAETRQALIKATITLLHDKGYGGTTTELVADAAGVSRGALRHHFATRAQLMAAVIEAVYEDEHRAYQRMTASTDRGASLADWPDMLWEVLSRPSGQAVLEILQAARSQPDLARLVGPVQARVERLSLASMRERFPQESEAELLAAIRFFVWAIRGMSIAQVLFFEPKDIARSIAFFRRLVAAGVHDTAAP